MDYMIMEHAAAHQSHNLMTLSLLYLPILGSTLYMHVRAAAARERAPIANGSYAAHIGH